MINAWRLIPAAMVGAVVGNFCYALCAMGKENNGEKSDGI